MATINDVINLALDEIGYLEKKSNASLESKTDNAGSANYTKYARDLDAISYFNGAKNGYSWCSVFVHWLLYKCFGKENTLKMCYEPSTENYGAGVDYLTAYFKTKGKAYSTPQVGDFVVFSSKYYTHAHVGLVYKIDSSKIYTIEGNTSGASGVVSNGGGVFKKSYAKSYKYILCYLRPNWDVVGGYDYEEGDDGEVNLPTLQQGSSGSTVKALQVLLIGYGIGVGLAGADGDYGKGTKNGVIKYQQAHSECGTADGIVGQNTWKSLLGIK